MKQNNSFFKRNGLLIVFGFLMLVTLAGQAITGWHESNEERLEKKLGLYSFAAYLHSCHFTRQHLKTGKVNFFKWVYTFF